jgi:lipoprotein-anchoring transpeptidase ErfK/SrfK
LLFLVWGCVKKPVTLPTPPLDMGLTKRTISEKELSSLCENDPDLTVMKCLEILSRLNTKAIHYIQEDMKKGKPLKTPNDFTAYKNWTPLPSHIPAAANIPKFILIVKNEPFLGWYDHGSLLDDTLICIGKKWDWTKAGVYKVEEKDENHFSMSYPDASGRPAAMPFALRIYERVWIHAGDISTGNCSHGCINLPVMAAMDLFRWAKLGATVVIVDSLSDLGKAMEKS